MTPHLTRRSRARNLADRLNQLANDADLNARRRHDYQDGRYTGYLIALGTVEDHHLRGRGPRRNRTTHVLELLDDALNDAHDAPPGDYARGYTDALTHARALADAWLTQRGRP